MERIVVPAQAVQNSLLRSNLVLGGVIRFPILGNRFGLRWAGDDFGKLVSGGLSAKVEAGTLCARQSRGVQISRIVAYK